MIIYFANHVYSKREKSNFKLIKFQSIVIKVTRVLKGLDYQIILEKLVLRSVDKRLYDSGITNQKALENIRVY